MPIRNQQLMKKLLYILKKLLYILDNLLSILGKIIVASLIGLFILYLSFQNKMDDKKYEEDAKVNFRGIKFQFPMRVHGVLKTPMSGFSRNYMWLQTDSIGCKISLPSGFLILITNGKSPTKSQMN